MYSVPQNQQLIIFLASIGLGFLLGIFYDILRTVRLTITKSNVGIIIFDVIYFIFFGFASFLFILAMNKGEVRIYIPIGEIIGWLFYYFSFGLAAIKITDLLVKVIRGFFALIFKIITLPFRLIYKGLRLICKGLIRLVKKIENFFKKLLKKLLPKAYMYVYNLFGIVSVRRNNPKKGGRGFGKHKCKEEKEN